MHKQLSFARVVLTLNAIGRVRALTLKNALDQSIKSGALTVFKRYMSPYIKSGALTVFKRYMSPYLLAPLGLSWVSPEQ